MGKNIARLYSAELEGIDAKVIEVEADVSVGLHRFEIVGLADKALNEARERINSALKNSGVKSPNRENRKITINLAPAHIKKAGSHYDLSIALGYLLATRQIEAFDASDKLFLGELALDGRLRPIVGALNIAETAAQKGFKFIFLPAANANEAAIIAGITVIPLAHLREVIAFLEERISISPQQFSNEQRAQRLFPDFSEIKDQENAKRALTIAASGRHNILMTGPPGVGKSFLARAAIGIMPDLERTEAIEVMKIWSATGLGADSFVRERPFRAPHQTISLQALIGGGFTPRPGEVSLAHRGVLFLDELAEFNRNALESLREPLETGSIKIARAKSSFVFPANFMLIAAMNPCPCGYFGSPETPCKCLPAEVLRYQKRISGPLLDRIDIQIKLERVSLEKLRSTEGSGLATPKIRTVVERARQMQKRRFGSGERSNASIQPKELPAVLRLDASGDRFLAALEGKSFSPRSYHRLLKVARTIADIEQKENTSGDHLAEAFGYRLREN